MQEEVLERIEKDKTGVELNELPETEPSEKQKEYILPLSREVGLDIDISKLKDRKQASLLIDRLKLLNRQMNRNNDERKSTFEFATQLVFANYREHGKDPIKYKRFWKDVRFFYEEYTKHQEILMSKEVV